MNDYIEVNTSVENPEYPTRVRIIGYDGTFEHAGDYSAPRYDFSVQVEVRYNKVVDGKEENLIKCTFWTTEDYSTFSYEDDDLDDDSVDDWFWEGLSEDLSFHDLECLEGLDLYALGVPTCEEDAGFQDVEDYLTKAFDECLGEHYEDYEYQCSKLFEQRQEHEPIKKELTFEKGDCKTVWSIDGVEFERDYEDDVNAAFYVSCCLYINDEMLFCAEFKTEMDYLMHAYPHDLYEHIVKKIEKTDFQELVAAEDESAVCNSFDSFTDIMQDNDSFEEYVADYFKNEYTYDEYEDVEVTLGDLAEEWEKRYSKQ